MATKEALTHMNFFFVLTCPLIRDQRAVQEGACKVMHAFLLPATYNSSDPNQATIVVNEATRQRFAGVGAIEPLGKALQQHSSSVTIASCGCEVCLPFS